MKILVIGDPHGSKKVKDIPLENVDLILCTGDLGKADLARKMAFDNIDRARQGLPEKEYTPKQEKRAYVEAHDSALKLMKYLAKFAPVYTIFGNIENLDEEVKKKSKELKIKLPLLEKSLKEIKNVKVINDKLVRFNGIKILGLNYFIDTSWIKEFKPENYAERLEMAREETSNAKKVLKKLGKTDILVCHQPPFGVLDKVNFPQAPKHWQNKHAGSKVILDYIKSKKPKYVFCGHIHEAKGKKKVGKTEVYNLGCAGDYFLLKI